jgi:hypothetical protein
MPGKTALLSCQAPWPSTLHAAPDSLAPWGEIVTVKEPVCGLTVIVLEVAVIEGFAPVNAPVMVWLPTAFKVAENVPEPLVSAAFAGSFADPSVLVNCIMPK